MPCDTPVKIFTLQPHALKHMPEKLRKRGIGVNEVEEYARKEIGRGNGGGEQFRQVRRKEIVRALMKSKVRSAEVELEETRRQFLKVDSYLRRRWGQHREAMSRYATILQAEVRKEWEEGGVNVRTRSTISRGDG